MIVVVNGRERSGKDSFCLFAQRETERLGGGCHVASTVDLVKTLARNAGWRNTKTPKDRKFLSDLKDLLTEWDDIPYKDIETNYKFYRLRWNVSPLGNGNEDKFLFFVMCREPEEIEKFVDRLGAKTLLIRRESAESEEPSNHADANVFNYSYDFTIENNGTLEELEVKAKKFVDELFGGNIE